MANRYFRNTGTGVWNTASNWSTTDGGGADAAVPLATDDVFFTSLSLSCTVNTASAVAKSLNFTGYTNTITMTNAITVSGSVTLSNTMAIAGTSGLSITTTATLTSNGKVFGNNLSFQTGTYTITFADNWDINTLTTVSAGIRTFSGSTVTVRGGLALGSTTGGLSNTILLAGTGSFSGGGILKSNLIINTAGTITINNTGTWDANFTYVAGTVIVTGHTAEFSGGNQTIDSNTMHFNAVIISGTGTITLLSDMIINGTLNSSSNGANHTLNGFTAHVSGGISFGQALAGTTVISLEGTGTWTGAFTLSCPLVINTSGTITIGTSVLFNGSLTYVTGTVTTTSSTLSINGTTTLDTAGISWNNVSLTSTGTVTINSTLTVTGTLAFSNSDKTLAGTAGFIAATLQCQSTGTSTYTFKIGVTYRITTLLQAVLTSPSNRTLFKSDTSSTKTNIRIDTGATCTLGYVDFTDVDASSGGRAICTFNGILTRTVNISTYKEPFITTAKSYAA